MHVYYILKHSLKIVRWQARRTSAALRWGPSTQARMPAVLGNAMPKSGSHLIIQVLRGLAQLGPFVDPGFPPVNRAEDNHKLPDRDVLANLQHMRPGDVSYGYIAAHEPFTSALTAPGRATIFVYRDPRDTIISHVFYATQMHPRHWMRRYYTEEIHTMEERINAAIQGVTQSGSELTPIYDRYQSYLGWLDQPSVCCLRFEDLILNRNEALGCLLDYLKTRGFDSAGVSAERSRSEAIETLAQGIAPRKSGTYRQAKPGNWREYFTDANKALFKEKTGQLLIQLGYEADDNW